MRTLSLIFTRFVNISLFLYVPGKLPARIAEKWKGAKKKKKKKKPSSATVGGGKKKDILFRRVCFMYLSLWWLGKKFIDGLIKINRIERRGKNNVENSRADGNKSN